MESRDVPKLGFGALQDPIPTPPRVRFAPSPTGSLHVGGARTALYNFLFARRHGGMFILRIEDTDAARSLPEHEAGLMADLRWLGLGWDEGIDAGGELGPYRQSERTALYRERAEDLVRRGLAYPCFCSPDLLEKERAAQREAGAASLYSGRCRRIPPAEATARRSREEAALRLGVAAVAAGESGVSFTDRVHGAIRFPLTQIGDFVLLRRDGTPSYNFAVVADDLAMRVSHVVRGDDHLSNTPRQILVYRAFGATALPEFAHVPLILAPGGQPLSKRLGGSSVGWFRQHGYPPEALLNYLALLGWSHPAGQEFLSREELVESFDVARLSKAPAVFDRQKLDALSLRHMGRMPPARLAELAADSLVQARMVSAPIAPGAWEWIGRLAALYSDRLPAMGELPAAAALLYDFSPEKSRTDPDVRSTLSDAPARRVIEALLAHLGTEPLTAPRFQELVDRVRRETGAKGKDLYHPLRIGLTGSASGPELVRLLPLIDEGSRLDLPRRIVPCADRARALLAAPPE